MATNSLHLNSRQRLAARVATAAAAALTVIAASSAAATAAPEPVVTHAQIEQRCAGRAPDRTTLFVAAPAAPRTYAYSWPLKPFNRQHPVRGFFNDPREARDGSRSFHFGIDISAPDGTAVYAVQAGRVRGKRGRSVNVVTAERHVTSYYHIVPVVSEGQTVRRHQLLGHIEAPWGHVHFAEAVDGRWVNPLRPGALGPFVDTTAPTVARMRVVHNHRRGSHSEAASELVVDAYDTTPLRVAAPWNDLPVAPAVIAWRIIGERTASAWQIGVDFRLHMPNASRFWQVYASDTKKNHPPRAGRYCFRVARWQSREFRGAVAIEVAVSDTRGNRTIARLTLRG